MAQMYRVKKRKKFVAERDEGSFERLVRRSSQARENWGNKEIESRYRGISLGRYYQFEIDKSDPRNSTVSLVSSRRAQQLPSWRWKLTRYTQKKKRT